MITKTIALTIALLGLHTPAIAQPIAWVQGPQSLKLTPSFRQTNPKTLLQQAIAAMDNYEMDRAVQILDRAIAQDPGNSSLKQHLYTALLVGGSEAAEGLPVFAIEQLKRAIALKPTVSSPWAGLGKAYCALARDARYKSDARKNVKSCIASYEKAIQLTTKFKPHYLRNFAESMAKISPISSAQLFDLSTVHFLRQGDKKSAQTTVWMKRQTLGI